MVDSGPNATANILGSDLRIKRVLSSPEAGRGKVQAQPTRRGSPMGSTAAISQVQALQLDVFFLNMTGMTIYVQQE